MNSEYKRLIDKYSVGQEITIYDLSNYSCSIKLPMKGTIREITEYPCIWVTTEKEGEFELYSWQLEPEEEEL